MGNTKYQMMTTTGAGGGALKEILIESGIGVEIGNSMNYLNINPLLLGWLIAAVIRVSIGSATVA